MKRKLLYVYLSLFAIFCLTVHVPLVSAAESEDQYIVMYKTFFKDIEGKRYKKAWDAMTEASKNAVAKSVSNKIVSEKKEAVQADVLKKLESNSDNLRTNYFDHLNEEFQKITFQEDIKKADFEVKSSSKERIVITITVNKAPKDFEIVREAGKWKINFFDDLMR
jgi:vacuolar-type H+-ATPase catalytic subunit A/Vma1